jgi:iron complex outermembrane receptor protein
VPLTSPRVLAMPSRSRSPIRSVSGIFRFAVLPCASLGASAFGAIAQQSTLLPEIVAEERQRQVKVTNSRLQPATAGKPEAASAGTNANSPAASGAASAPAASTEAGFERSGIAGASTTIVTREQIARSPQATLPDIIAREAGVQTTSLFGGVNGAGTTVDLRGFGATASSNTLVLVDGRRLNDWDQAGFDLSTLAKDSVERIEITRGNSAAVLYGDGAVGGVINIVTRSGAGAPAQARVEAGLGSFNTRQGSASASASAGGFSAFANASALSSDGYRLNNKLEQQSASGDFRYTFEKGSVFFSVAGDEQSVGLPGERRVRPAGLNELRDDRRGTIKPLDYAEKQGLRGTLGFTYILGPGVEVIVDGGVRTKEQQAGFFSQFEENYVDTNLTTRSLTPRISMTQPFLGLPSRVIAGLDAYDTDYESRRSMFKGLAPVHIYSGGQETLAGYWQHTVDVLPTTRLSYGARLQRSKTTARDLYDPLAPQGFVAPEGVPLDESETNRAWHLGAEQQIVPGVTLIARAAQSFRVPNIDERIGSALFGVATDFNLRTQKSHDWEAGIRLEQGPFRLQSSYYEMRLTDEIQLDPINFLNKNIDPTARRGVETIASWQVFKSVRVFGNVTYTEAVFRAGENLGNDVPLVSRWTGNLGLSWSIIDKTLAFDAIARYVGERRMDNDQANFQPLIPAFTTVDLQLSGKMDYFFWSAGVANVLDEKYFDYSVASAFTQGAYNAYPQPGRTFMVKAGVSW